MVIDASVNVHTFSREQIRSGPIVNLGAEGIPTISKKKKPGLETGKERFTVPERYAESSDPGHVHGGGGMRVLLMWYKVGLRHTQN